MSIFGDKTSVKRKTKQYFIQNGSVFMNLIDYHYNLIAKAFNTDMIGAKETLCRYIEDLKERIDNSDDEKAKIFWYEEFGEASLPDPDTFLVLLFMSGNNPFLPKT